MNTLKKKYFSPLSFFHDLCSSHFFKQSGSVLRIFIFSFFVLISFTALTQDNSGEYKKTIHDRAAKIVNQIGLTDSASYQRVLVTITNQYYQLNTIQEKNKTAVEAIKKQTTAQDSLEQQLKKQEENKSALLIQLHGEFLTLLKRDLTDTQVEKVKDAITYRVLPITYAAYQDMIPDLTKEQKEKIYAWLLEARELAMDAESSEKKHAVFGKYKGRINNYLSAAGYDLKKEGEEWEKRKTSGAATAK